MRLIGIDVKLNEALKSFFWGLMKRLPPVYHPDGKTFHIDFKLTDVEIITVDMPYGQWETDFKAAVKELRQKHETLPPGYEWVFTGFQRYPETSAWHSTFVAHPRPPSEKFNWLTQDQP